MEVPDNTWTIWESMEYCMDMYGEIWRIFKGTPEMVSQRSTQGDLLEGTLGGQTHWIYSNVRVHGTSWSYILPTVEVHTKSPIDNIS